MSQQYLHKAVLCQLSIVTGSYVCYPQTSVDSWYQVNCYFLDGHMDLFTGEARPHCQLALTYSVKLKVAACK